MPLLLFDDVFDLCFRAIYRKRLPDSSKPTYRNINGQRVVLVSEAEFNELRRHADLDAPALPEADADGNRPADAYAAVSQARGILRAAVCWDCRKWTWPAVPRFAGKHSIASNTERPCRVPTIAKIDKALKQAAKGR